MEEITTLAVAYAAIQTIAPAAKVASELVEKLLGEPFTVAGSLMADRLYYWQTLNRINYFVEVQKRLKRKAIPASVVPPGFLMPIVEAVGNVDDPDLRERWVRLTVSGIEDAGKRHPMYADVLRRFSVEDAKLFETIINSMTTSLGHPLGTSQDAGVFRLISLGLMEYVYVAEMTPVVSEPHQTDQFFLELERRKMNGDFRQDYPIDLLKPLQGFGTPPVYPVKLFRPSAHVTDFGRAFYHVVADPVKATTD